MGIFNVLNFYKHQSFFPKNLIMFDFANFNKNKKHELQYENKKYEELKIKISNKIFRANEIEMFQLQKANSIINEYNNLKKQIWCD